MCTEAHPTAEGPAVHCMKLSLACAVLQGSPPTMACTAAEGAHLHDSRGMHAADWRQLLDNCHAMQIAAA